MDKLKDLNAVAYVRFASVYREFKDVETFMNELKKMLVQFFTQAVREKQPFRSQDYAKQYESGRTYELKGADS